MVGYALSHYEVLEKLGEGGMGQVWKARDVRLGRPVALKVLNSTFSEDPEFRRRFLREAKAISVLNHPNICTLFDIGEESGLPFLVMELLEGQSLAARLQEGPLPAQEAVQYGAQIADALEAAHRSGIVHRDLKPGNVLLVRAGAQHTAKLLDFGLAKIVRPESGTEPAAASAPLTRAGIVMGTLNYMAPEQIQGKELDGRTDIFSFGALLYEMLTGTKAFRGESQTAVMTAILSADPPPVSALSPVSPPELDRLVQRCLAKDPGVRFQSAKDLFAELMFIGRQFSAPVAPPPLPAVRRGGGKLPWAVAAAALILGASGWAAAGYLAGRPPAAPGPKVTFTVNPPAGETLLFTGLAAGAALSPDGARLAYVATLKGAPTLWIRKLDSLDAAAVEGAEGASFPFWSPAGTSIAFFAGGKLKRVDLGGGAPVTVANAPAGRGGSWTPERTMLFTADASGSIFEVPDTGGEPVRLTQPDPARKEDGHFWPQAIPGGTRFLYLARSVERSGSHIEVGDRRARAGAQRPQRIIRSNYNAAIAGGSLYFVNGGGLYRQSIDPASLQLAGEPQSVASGVGTLIHINYADFSAARAGAVAWRQGGQPLSRLTWFDRRGAPQSAPSEPAVHVALRLSPSAAQAVTARSDAVTGVSDLWLHDLAAPSAMRVTFDSGRDFAPVWSPGGDQIAFASTRDGVANIYIRAAAGTSASRRLTRSARAQRPLDWALDSKVLYEETDPDSARDLWIVDAAGTGQPVRVTTSAASEVQGRFSPDGRWIAYASDESGRFEVYVRDHPFTGAQWQVSTAGGKQPVWRGDGRELYFVAESGDLMAAPIAAAGASLRPGTPVRLFTLEPDTPGWNDHRYDVTRDGQRFLLLAPARAADGAIAVRVGAF
ncbi:MAG TPA: hypothetical protein DEH78_31625 [Solibacterales bacterium]|nr:hypothetical protein [Bryobacterales bacterium]